MRREIVGRQEIVGRRGGDFDSLMEEVAGSYYHTAGAQAQQFGPRGQPAAYSQDPNGPQLVDKPATSVRQFPVGFITASLAATASANPQVQPQVAFRGERLAVSNSIAPFFTISDIKVGKDSQLAVAGALPAEPFSNLSVGVRTLLDTAEPGIVVVLSVTNTDPAAAAHIFSAVMYGTVIE